MRVESSGRWVRVFSGEHLVASSRRALLLLRPGRFAVYFFPVADLVGCELRPCAPLQSDPNPRFIPGAACDLEGPPDLAWDLVLPSRVIERAAWGFARLPAAASALAGHVALVWDGMDRWYEEAEQIFVHPRSPYHRVDLLPSERHVVVRLGDEVIAESARPLAVFETGLPPRFYIAESEVRRECLVPSSRTSYCVYKGRASYWHVRSDTGRLVEDAAWAYPRPLPAALPLAGRIAFMNGLLDVFVDGEKQQTLW